MLTLSRAARAAILLSGAALATMPVMAVAKDKKKEAAAPAGPQLSPEFRKAAQPAQAGLQAAQPLVQQKNYDAAAAALAPLEPSIAAVEAAAKTEDDQYYAQYFRLQYEDMKLQSAAKGDVGAYQRGETALVAPLKALVANPKTPKEDIGRYQNRLGEVAYDAKDYAGAVQLFEAARASGYANPNLLLNIARSKAEGGDVQGGVAQLRQAIDAEKAAGRVAPESWYFYARAKLLKAGDLKGALAWTREVIAAYPTQKNWYESLLLFGFNGPYKLDKREKIDVFRLMRATKSLNDQQIYAEYAENLFDVGLPNEAKAVIDEGRAAGKVPGTGGLVAMVYGDSLTAMKNSSSNEVLAKRAAASPNGITAAATGDAYLGDGDYAKAIELYRLAISKGGLTKVDEVMTHLGIAQALSGDKAGAKATFATIKSPSRADIATFWTLWLDLPKAA